MKSNCNNESLDPMCREVQYFKASRAAHCFSKNQVIWIRYRDQNRLQIWFKSPEGRYVSRTVGRFAPFVSKIETIEVDNTFADRIEGVPSAS